LERELGRVLRHHPLAHEVEEQAAERRRPAVDRGFLLPEHGMQRAAEPLDHLVADLLGVLDPQAIAERQEHARVVAIRADGVGGTPPGVLHPEEPRWHVVSQALRDRLPVQGRHAGERHCHERVHTLEDLAAHDRHPGQTMMRWSK
jgi:hypothetical protein